MKRKPSGVIQRFCREFAGIAFSVILAFSMVSLLFFGHAPLPEVPPLHFAKSSAAEIEIT
jgi:hypothetical protein